MTVGAPDDFGYTVSYVGAESYTAPASAATQAAAPVVSTLAASIVAAPVAPLIGPIRDTLPQATRRLPLRITFADRPPMILSDTEASRELVRTSLASLGGD